MKLTFVLLFIVFLTGCSVDENLISTEYSGKGYIRKSVNTFTIDSDDGRKFVATNLADEFKVVNIRVEFKGNLRHDNSAPNNFEIIELTFIRRIQ